jgi:hypothetical protein
MITSSWLWVGIPPIRQLIENLFQKCNPGLNIEIFSAFLFVVLVKTRVFPSKPHYLNKLRSRIRNRFLEMTRQQLQKFLMRRKIGTTRCVTNNDDYAKPRNLNVTTLKGLRIVFSYTFRVLFYSEYVIKTGLDLQPVESDSHVFNTVTCIGHVDKLLMGSGLNEAIHWIFTRRNYI